MTQKEEIEALRKRVELLELRTGVLREMYRPKDSQVTIRDDVELGSWNDRPKPAPYWKNDLPYEEHLADNDQQLEKLNRAPALPADPLNELISAPRHAE